MLNSGILKKRYLGFYGGLDARERQWLLNEGKGFAVKEEIKHPRLHQMTDNGGIFWEYGVGKFHYGLMPMLNDYKNYKIRVIDAVKFYFAINFCFFLFFFL